MPSPAAVDRSQPQAPLLSPIIKVWPGSCALFGILPERISGSARRQTSHFTTSSRSACATDRVEARPTRACVIFYQTWSVQRATYAACMSAVQRVVALVQFRMLGCVSKMFIISAKLKVFA